MDRTRLHSQPLLFLQKITLSLHEMYPSMYDSVLAVLQVCVQDFCEELEYWGLNDLHLEPCCQHTYYRARWLLPSYGIQVTR